MSLLYKLYLFLGLNSVFLGIILGNAFSDDIYTLERSKKHFLTRYGINLVIALDQVAQEYFSDNTAVTHECINLLKNPSSILLMDVNIFKNIEQSCRVDDLLHQWFLYTYKHDRDLLLFVPKVLEPHSGVDEDLCIDFSQFQEIPNPIECYKNSKFFDVLPTAISKYLVMAYNELKNIIRVQSSIVKAVQSLVVAGEEKKLTVCLNGHGSPVFMGFLTIGGLYAYHFNALINVLHDKKCVKALLYSTCYGGSKASLEDFYGTRTFNYSIFCASFDNSVSYSKRSNLALFFEQFKNCALDRFHRQVVAKCINGYFSYTKQPNNIPHVRWSGESMFEIVPQNVEDGVVILSRYENTSNLKQVVDEKPESTIDKIGRFLGFDGWRFLIDKSVINRTIQVPSARLLRIATRNQKIHYVAEFELSSLNTIENLGKYIHRDDGKHDLNEHIVLVDRIYYHGNTKIINNVIVFIGDPGYGPKNSIYFEDPAGQGCILDVEKHSVISVSTSQSQKYRNYFITCKQHVLDGKGQQTESYLTKLHTWIAYQHPITPIACGITWDVILYLISKKNKKIANVLSLGTLAAIAYQCRKDVSFLDEIL